MTTIQEIYEALDRIAPFHRAEPWDNSGLLIGGKARPVSKVVLALDATLPVVEEAIQLGADLILTHHPVIFHPLKMVSSQSVVYRLIEKGISVISAHTNLDVAAQGVNEQLAKVLQLQGITSFTTVSREFSSAEDCYETYSLGRMGQLPGPMSPAEFGQYVKEKLNCTGIRLGRGNRPIATVAVCGGSGGSLIEDAIGSGADALVSADIKHDQYLLAAEAGLILVDAGHHSTETVVLPPLMEWLEQQFPEVTFAIAKNNQEAFICLS